MPRLLQDAGTLVQGKDTFEVDPELYDRVFQHANCVLWRNPRPVIIFGSPNRGKTTLLNQLDRDLDGKIIHVTCDEMRVTDLFREMLRECDKPAPNYQSMMFLRNRLKEAFQQYDQVVLLIDDAHNIDDLEPFFNFLRNRPTFETRIVSVLTTAKVGFLGNVDERILSHLCPVTHVIGSPSPSQSEAILRTCAERSLVSDCVDETVYRKLASYIFEEFGNVSTGLKLLTWAAKYAELSGDSEIRIDHLARAEEKLEREIVVNQLLIKGLTVHQQAILAALNEARRTGSSPMSTSQLYPEYSNIMAENGLETISLRNFREHFKNLCDPFFVKIEKRQKNKQVPEWYGELIIESSTVENALAYYGDLKSFSNTGEEFDPVKFAQS